MLRWKKKLERVSHSILGILVSITASITSGQPARAQTSSAPISQSQQIQETVEPKKNWSAAVVIGADGNARELEQASSFSMDLLGSYKWTDTLSTSLTIGWGQDFTPEEKTSFNNVLVSQSWITPLKLYNIENKLSFRITAPTSQAAQDQSLITALRLRTDFSRTWFNLITLKPFGSFSYGFYKYETATGDFPGEKPNVRYSLVGGSALEVSYGILTAGTEWSFIRQTTYVDSIRYLYSNDFYIAVQPLKMLSLQVGVANGRVGGESTARNGGRDSNFTVFDQDRTTIYGESTISF